MWVLLYAHELVLCHTNIHGHLMEEAAYLSARKHVSLNWGKVSSFPAKCRVGRQPVNRENRGTSFGRNTHVDNVKQLLQLGVQVMMSKTQCSCYLCSLHLSSEPHNEDLGFLRIIFLKRIRHWASWAWRIGSHSFFFFLSSAVAKTILGT